MDVNIKIPSLTAMNPRPYDLSLPPKTILSETFGYALGDNDPLIAVTSKFPTMLTLEKANTKFEKIISLTFLYGQTNILLEMN